MRRLAVVVVMLARAAAAEEPCGDERTKLQEQLASERAALASAKQQLTSDIASFNSSCGQSSTDACRAQRQALATRQRELNARIDRWQADKRRYEQLEAAGPAIDPGSFVDRQSYEAAKHELEHLTEFQAGLERELARIEKSSGNLEQQRREFANIRAEALHGIYSDALTAVPVGRVAKAMAEEARWAKYVTPERAAEIDAAYQALRASVAAVDVATAKPGAQQLRDTVRTVSRARDAMLAIPIAELAEDDVGRKWLVGTGKTFSAFGAVVAFELEQQQPRASAPKDESRLMALLREVGPPAKLAIDVAAAYVPPVAIGKAIESLGERGATWYVTRDPVKALESALSADWSARYHLTTKLAEVKARRVEQERLVSAYEKCHAR